MAEGKVKSPEQIRREYLLNNCGYFLLHLLVLILQISFCIIVCLGWILQLPAIYAVVWPWLCSTRSAMKVRSAYKSYKSFFDNMSPPCALLGIVSVGIFHSIVASMEGSGGIEELPYFLNTLATFNVPLSLAVILLILTFAVTRLSFGYDKTCSEINKFLHAPPSVIELLDQNKPPGAYPITLDTDTIAAIQHLLTAKDREIARLENDVQQENGELADLLAQKDKEISKLKDALREMEEHNAGPQAQRHPNMRNSSSPWSHHVLTEQIRKTKEQLQDALASKADLKQKVASQEKETVALNKDKSALRSELEKANDERATLRAELKKAKKELPTSRAEFKKVRFELEPEPSAVLRDPIVDRYRQKVTELRSRLSHESRENAKSQQSTTDHYHKKISDLEEQLKHRSVDAANERQSIIDQCNQQLSNLRAELEAEQQNRHYVENQLLQKQAELNNVSQQASTLEAQLSKLDQQLRNEQQAHVTVRNQLNQTHSKVYDITGQYTGPLDPLDYLAQQIRAANNLYWQNDQLKKDHERLKQEWADSASQSSNQFSGSLQIQTSSEAELQAAKQQIVELSASNEQLQRDLKDPRITNPLCAILLQDKDKEIARVRDVLHRTQVELNTINATGKPSSRFVQAHEKLLEEKRALKDRFTKLETKFYAVEIKAANSQARERTLTGQLDRYRKGQRGSQPTTPVPSSNMQVQEAELTAFRNVQQERDEAVQKHDNLVTQSEEVLDAALRTVDWQVQGGTELEAEQKCAELDNHYLAQRLKPVLAEIRYKIQDLEASKQLMENQLIDKRQLVGPATPSATSAGAANKRKGNEGEEGGTERGEKHQRQY